MIFEFELASLDIGNTSVSSENQIKGATAESDLLIGPTEQFQANFDLCNFEIGNERPFSQCSHDPERLISNERQDFELERL